MLFKHLAQTSKATALHKPKPLPTLALAISLSLTGLVGTPMVHADTSAQASHNFNIDAGTLDAALVRFGQQSGVLVSVSGDVSQSKQTPGLEGNYSVEQGLELLLQGTDLRAVRQENGSYVVEVRSADGVMTLPPVRVAGDRETMNGSAEAGYVSQAVSQVGPWQGRELQDVPYSINVVPAELIENLQASSADQVFKLNPVTQMHWPQTQNDNPYVFMRGFQSTTFARNGISRQRWNYAHGTTMEEVERMEILTGLSGFLYGAGNVGGMVNFVTKRPTEDHLNSVTLTNTGGSNVLMHGDFGGPIDNQGRFGYRINAVVQDGETQVKHQNNQRNFISGAFDWNVTEDLLIQFDASRREYRLDGRQAYWYLAPNVTRPSASKIDSSETWGQKWTMQDIDSQRWGLSARWHANDWLTLRGGYLDEFNSRTGTSASNTIQVDSTYNQRISTNRDAAQKIEGRGAYFFADMAFDTGSISHKLTAGVQYSDSIWQNYPDGSVQAADYTGLPLSSPSYFDRPSISAHGTQRRFSGYDQRTRSITLGDDVTFNDQWSVLIGFSQSQVFYKNYNAAGEKTADYDKSEITPTLSLIYKPEASLTLYASFMEGLEQGGVAAETFGALNVINANAVMPPLVSQQIEIGAKKTLGDVLLTTALFEIDKPLEYYETISSTEARFVQDGRQVHRGLEFTATGKPMSQLTIVGGFTLLDAKVRENQQTPALEGKRPVDVAERMAKLYAEYDLLGVPGLVLNAGVSYTGGFYGDNMNTDKMSSYTLIDVGARYITDAGGRPLTLRLNVNNLTDERYWANRFFLGDARFVTLSANMKF